MRVRSLRRATWARSSSIFSVMNLEPLIASARIVAGVPFERLSVRYDSLGAMLEARASDAPDKTWLVYYDEDGARTELSYGSFADLVRRTASFLTSVGIGRGDRVATFAHN